MNKNERKYFSTAILFDEALIDLLETKEVEYITIKEICVKAKVNRSTFYLHYESINDLLCETIDYVNKKFINYFDEKTEDFIEKIKNSPIDDLYLLESKYLIPYLSFVKDNKNVFKASIKNPVSTMALNKYNRLKKYIINPILDRYSVPLNERNYILSFYISGIIAIIKEWVKLDCAEDIDNIVNIILKCVKDIK